MLNIFALFYHAGRFSRFRRRLRCVRVNIPLLPPGSGRPRPILPIISLLLLGVASGGTGAQVESNATHNDNQPSEFPRRTLTQYVHRAWTFNAGLPGSIQAITHTPDGFLWLGTGAGLVRFDGLNFKVLDPTNTPSMTSGSVSALVTGLDGSLWVGTEDGLLRLKDRTFTRYTEHDGLAGNKIRSLRIGWDGVLLADSSGEAFGSDRLSRWNNGRFVNSHSAGEFFASGSRHCFGQTLLRDRAGNKWATSFVDQGVSITLNGKRVISAPRLSSHPPELMFEDQHGTVWIRTSQGLYRFANGKTQQYRLSVSGPEPEITCLSEDRSGDVWIGTRGQGLFRWTPGGAQRFTTCEGLSSDVVGAILEEGDGNHWVVTAKGLDLLQEGLFVPYGATEGLSDEPSLTLMETHDGSIWVGTLSGNLYRLKGETVVAYRGLTRVGPNSGGGQSFIGKAVLSLYQTTDEKIWVGSVNGVQLFRDGKLMAAPAIVESTSGNVMTMYEDSKHTLWLGTERGLVGVKNGISTRYLTTPGAAINAVSVITGSADGGLWIGTSGGGLRHFKDGVFTNYTAANGLSHEVITALHESADGTLWIGTAKGLNSLKNGKFTVYSTRADPVLQGQICAILEDNENNLWMSSLRGIIRVPSFELASFASGKANSLSYMRFGIEDGMRSPVCSAGTQPTALRDHQGQFWFATSGGIVRLDPQRILREAQPQAVFVDSVVADLIPIDPVRGGSVPPGKNDLEIHYTAPSFRDANKIEFRYKLAEFDDNWLPAGTRRSAYYTNIPPGRYLFQVQVRNLNGLWNEPGAFVEINLKPHFYQMVWLRILFTLALAWLLTGLYLRRKKQLAAQMQSRLEERLADRTRIAQELHDTFLQDIVGLVFNIELASNELPSQAGTAKGRLQIVLNQLRQTVAAGRRVLTDLRSPNISYADLAKALSRLREQLESETGPAVEVQIEGNVSWLPPLVGDEVFQIGREALFNAVRHARAGLVKLTLGHADHELVLRVVDDGCGIEPEVLRRGRPGHFGLQGMKERSERIKAQFSCRSLEGGGTEIVLRVPLPPAADRGSMWFLRSAGRWLTKRNQ